MLAPSTGCETPTVTNDRLQGWVGPRTALRAPGPGLEGSRCRVPPRARRGADADLLGAGVRLEQLHRHRHRPGGDHSAGHHARPGPGQHQAALQGPQLCNHPLRGKRRRGRLDGRPRAAPVWSEPRSRAAGGTRSHPVPSDRYQVAQKLHACTEDCGEQTNQRARDLPDLLLIDRLAINDTDLPTIRAACVEIFTGRAKHPWPPVMTAWPTGQKSGPPFRPTKSSGSISTTP